MRRRIILFASTLMAVVVSLLYLSLYTGDLFNRLPVAMSSMKLSPIQTEGSQYKILLWSKYFYGPWPGSTGNGLIHCEQYQCIVTRDKRDFVSSHAVVFHGASLHHLAEYISIGKHFRSQSQRWIFYNRESPQARHGRYLKYRDVFNWTMTYKLDSDIVYPYADILPGKHGSGFDSKLNYLKGKIKSVVTVISNCYEPRLNLVKSLKKHIDVDIFGKCGTGKWCSGCLWSLKSYKFYLSFENSLCKDYITEKTYRNAFSNDLVPVIFSGANLSNPNVIPQGSYIDASKFTSSQELANYLEQVGSNSSLYNKFFEWRAHWSVLGYWSFLNTAFTCRICKKLHESYYGPPTTYDISKWYNKHKDCKPIPVWT